MPEAKDPKKLRQASVLDLVRMAAIGVDMIVLLCREGMA
jgi:hypothetical protein